MNINEASKSCGLSPSVLRIWELRYGWPSPVHFESGGLDYAPDQVADLKRIRGLISSGKPISNLIHNGRPYWNHLIDAGAPADELYAEIPEATSPLFLTHRVGFSIMDPMSYNKKSQPIYKAWLDRTSEYMQQKYCRQVFTGPVEVLIRSGNGVHVDADNLIKPLLDAVTRAGIWTDDRLVKKLTVIKDCIDQPVHLSIWRIIDSNTDSEPT